MDPLSVLGVAGNVIQVVDFSLRFLMQVKKLHDSADSEIEEFKNIQCEAKRLRSLNDSVIKAIKTRGTSKELTNLEQDILSLCTESDSVASDLLKELKDASWGQESTRTIAAFRGMVIALWKRKSIKNLERQLLGLRDMLTSTILANMQ